MNIAASRNDPTAALWESPREFIVHAFALRGASCAIAARAFALRETHAPLMHYLRQCKTAAAQAPLPRRAGAPPHATKTTGF